ncbi:MAG: MFS transporter [Opitutaceae bacterium]
MLSHKTNAFIYATIVAMGGFLFGLDAVLISGTLDFLIVEFGLSALEVGTAASAPALGVLIALPFAGYISDKFGRKPAILLIAVLYLISALGSAFATSFEMLVAARFLGGLAFSSITLASMYIGEIAPPQYRGKLVSMTQINIVVGLSGAYFVNHFIFKMAESGSALSQSLMVDTETWRWMLGSEIPFALLWLFLLIKIPESPYWLIIQDRVEDTKNVLRKLLPESEIDHHVSDMQTSLQHGSEKHTIGSQIKEIFSKPMRLTLVIAFTIAVAQQATGINAILVYAPTVFQQLGAGSDAAFTQAIWVGLTGLVFTVLGLLLVDKLGRRPLVIGGLLWVIISLGLSSYAFNQARYVITADDVTEIVQMAEAGEAEAAADALVAGEAAATSSMSSSMGASLGSIVDTEYSSDIAFKNALKAAIGEDVVAKHQNAILAKAINMNATLVLVCILSVVAAFHISIGPIMWVLFSEIFPITVRGIAIPFFAIVSSLVNYVVQQFFPWQLENMGMSAIFLCYGVTVAIGLMVLFFTLKETKGLSIEEIQTAFQSK